ncbi:MAG: hypothetical protein QME45_12870 [Clostridiales bacterium]|nr:hypothetical protein [Clostridiales bacterium]
MPYGYPAYGTGFTGYGTGYAGYGGYGGGTNWGVRWIYALLILIVIVLQFGRNSKPVSTAQTGVNPCDSCENLTEGTDCMTDRQNFQLIDNSVLFIIIVFLLVLCGGCWPGTGYSC